MSGIAPYLPPPPIAFLPSESRLKLDAPRGAWKNVHNKVQNIEVFDGMKVGVNQAHLYAVEAAPKRVSRERLKHQELNPLLLQQQVLNAHMTLQAKLEEEYAKVADRWWASFFSTARAVANTSHYYILDVELHASAAVIRSKYLKLALQYRLDKNSHDHVAAKMLFERISEAYIVLSDPAKRANYNIDLVNELDRDGAMEPSALSAIKASLGVPLLSGGQGAGRPGTGAGAQGRDCTKKRWKKKRKSKKKKKSKRRTPTKRRRHTKRRSTKKRRAGKSSRTR